MKNLMLKTTIAAVAAAFAGTAFAAVNLQDGTGVVKYASELAYTDTTPLVGAAGQLQVTGNLGFGVSSGATRYIRLTFGNAVLDGAAGALTGPDAGTIVQGGAAGDNYVIYQFTATVDRAPTAVVTTGDSAAGYRVTSNSSPVTVTYSLHETAVDAVNNTNPLFNAGPVNLATFAAGLAYTVTPRTATAEVTTGFKNFVAVAPGTTTLSRIGTVNYGTGAAVLNGYTGAGILLTDLVTAATKITVTGDFSAAAAAGDVFLAATNDGTCADGGLAETLNAGKNSVDVPVGTTAYDRDICYLINGTTVLNTQTINQMLDVTAVAGVSVSDTAASTLGNIARNGASTTALNITAPDNSDQTFVRISNLGGTTGKITGTLVGQDGTILGTADTTLVAAAGPRSTHVFSATDLASAFGVLSWTGRAKLVIVGEFPAGQLRAQNLIRVPNGTLVNVGGDTSGAGN